MNKRIRFLWTIMMFLFVLRASVYACSSFQIGAGDGSLICTRTMEFGVDTQSGIVVVPRGWRFSSPAPNGGTGLVWTSRFGFAACNAFGLQTTAVDGMNEKGLVFSALWYEPDTVWPTIGVGQETQALAHIELGSWILGNFQTVAEVKEALARVRVFGLSLAQLGGVVPLHFIVYDAAGGCMVIECDQGELHVYDNRFGLLTNAPGFPWMTANLRNYIGMSNAMKASGTICGVSLNGTGHGNGMIGLPGDLTPPSRFVRMAVTKQFAEQQPDALKALNQAQHIANSLNIVAGMVVDKDASGHITSQETTEWTTFYDLTHTIMYFQTYDNMNLRKIDFGKLDFNAEQLRFLPMEGTPEVMIDVLSAAE